LQICEAIIGEEKENKHSPDTLSGGYLGKAANRNGQKPWGLSATMAACKSMIAMDRRQRRNDKLRNQCGA
jgi:hypothetical protein